jgi:hypothetical protein
MRVLQHGSWKTLEQAPATFAHRQAPILIKFHDREKGIQLWSKLYYECNWDLSVSLRASDPPVAVVPAPSLSFLVVFMGLNWEQQQGDSHREDGT